MNPILRRIDFLGPSGVGKSTLCERVINSSFGEHILLSERDALYQYAIEKSREFRSPLYRAASFILKLEFVDSIHARLRRLALMKLLSRIHNPAAWDQKSIHSIRTLIGSSSRMHTCPERVIREFCNFFDAFERTALLHRYLDNRENHLVFCDESVTQKLMYAGPWPRLDKQLSRDICFLIGNLVAVVYVTAPPEIILSRYIQRSARRQQPVSLKKKLRSDISTTLSSSEQIVSALESNGVKVIRVDAGIDPETNAAYIKKSIGDDLSQ